MSEMKIGSEKWVRGEAMWGLRGKAHAALRLLLRGSITERKCLELLKELATFGECRAPWSELDWNAGNDPGSEEWS